MAKISRNAPCPCGSGKKYKKCCIINNFKKPSRDPGKLIKALLRKEVNFGCPVRYPDGSGCGSPILTYHHFDPPWSSNHIHNPEGMIALCPQHHYQADGGLWSNGQLKKFKNNPYVDDTMKIQWPWQPEVLLMKVGPSLVVGSGSPLRLRGKRVMGFKPKLIKNLGEKTIIFDTEIVDTLGLPWIKIEDGWFDLDTGGTADLFFKPQMKFFSAIHNDQTFINLHFKKYTVKDFKAYLFTFYTHKPTAENFTKSIEKRGIVDSDGYVPLMEIECSFKTPEVAVKIKGNTMKFQTFLPGLKETLEWHSWIVDEKHNVNLTDRYGKPFFSLG